MCFNKESLKESTERSGGVWSGYPLSRCYYSRSLGGHFTGGEPLRAVLPKDMKGRGHRNVQDKNITLLQSSAEGDVGHGVGYGVQLTFDVPVGKHIGVLD